MDNNIKDKIKQIKFSRLKPEERYLLNIFEKLEKVNHNNTKYNKSQFWKLDGQITLEYLSEYRNLRCSDKIYETTGKKFNLTHDELYTLFRQTLGYYNIIGHTHYKLNIGTWEWNDDLLLYLEGKIKPTLKEKISEMYNSILKLNQ